MTCHNGIMNLQINKNNWPDDCAGRFAYACGFRDARHAAAELAVGAEVKIVSLIEALEEAKMFAAWVECLGRTECEIYKHELKATADRAIERIDNALEMVKWKSVRDMTGPNKPSSICRECGLKHGTKKPVGAHTAVKKSCVMCGKEALTLPSRHYGVSNENDTSKHRSNI